MKFHTSILLCSIFITSLFGCDNKEPFQCDCNSNYLAFNDSIISDFRMDPTLVNRAKNFYGIDRLDSYETESYRLEVTHVFN